MKRISILFMVTLSMFLCSCEETEKNVETNATVETEMKDGTDEDTETVLYDEEYYRMLLAENTVETLAEIVVDDFDGDKKMEAFAITADPDVYKEYLAEPEMFEGCMKSSFWYLSKEKCINIYFEEPDAFIFLEQGILKDGTRVIKVQDWGAMHYTYDSFYTVENGDYKFLFSLKSADINADGTITEHGGTFTENGYMEEIYTYEYKNGELVMNGE